MLTISNFKLFFKPSFCSNSEALTRPSIPHLLWLHVDIGLGGRRDGGGQVTGLGVRQDGGRVGGGGHRRVLVGVGGGGGVGGAAVGGGVGGSRDVGGHRPGGGLEGLGQAGYGPHLVRVPSCL